MLFMTKHDCFGSLNNFVDSYGKESETQRRGKNKDT